MEMAHADLREQESISQGHFVFAMNFLPVELEP